MANETAMRLAKQIVEDLSGGAQYYKDPQVLAGFLQGSLGPSAAAAKGSEVAKAILEDWRGARYYADPEILAQFLEGRGVR